MPMILNFSEFCDIQACPHLYEDLQSLELFANGAVWHHDGRFGENPTDAVQLANAVIRYHQLVVAKAEQNYFNVQESVHNQIDFARRGCGPLPSDESLECLKLLKRDLKTARAGLVAAKENASYEPLNARKSIVDQQRLARRAQAIELQQQLQTQED